MTVDQMTKQDCIEALGWQRIAHLVGDNLDTLRSIVQEQGHYEDMGDVSSDENIPLLGVPTVNKIGEDVLSSPF